MVSTPARSPAKPCLRALITSSLAMRLRGTAASRLIPSCSHWRSDRKSTRLNSSHGYISYAVFCLKKKKKYKNVLSIIYSPTNHAEVAPPLCDDFKRMPHAMFLAARSFRIDFPHTEWNTLQTQSVS